MHILKWHLPKTLTLKKKSYAMKHRMIIQNKISEYLATPINLYGCIQNIKISQKQLQISLSVDSPNNSSDVQEVPHNSAAQKQIIKIIQTHKLNIF